MQNKLKNWLKEIRDYCVIKQSGLFDCEYYLRHNLDVAQSCVNPIMHYIRHGWREGRNPSEFFDTKWYLKTYPDVRESGINPLYHYIKHGLKEGRNALSTDYVLSPSDVLTRQINPITHARRKNNPQFLLPQIPFDLFKLQPGSFSNSYNDKQISIIVPVYNAYIELKKLLETIYDNSDIPFKLIAVDDASTDGRISELLASYEKKYNNFTVIRNAENLGFVATVNKGLKTAAQDDCVIINADVEVPKNWLFRLFYPLWAFDSIASVTPMSNSATLMSFPKFGHNDLPEGLSLQQVDDTFNKLNPEKDIYIETPTGHGFCMAMSHKAIEDIGVFDTIYGKGYGEENDWCMRALTKGYRNLIATNIFVYHKHSASFGTEARTRGLKRNIKIVENRYPNYLREVEKTQTDPRYNEIRDTLYFLMLTKAAQKKVVRFEHPGGGGSGLACDDFITNNKNDTFIAIIRPLKGKREYRLEIYYKNYRKHFSLSDNQQVRSVIDFIRPEKIIVNQLVGYSDLKNVISLLSEIKEALSLRLEINIRDYYPVCPQFKLMFMGIKFCGAAPESDCTSCLANSYAKKIIGDEAGDIQSWRQMWRNLFVHADQLTVFSNFTKNIIATVFPELEHKIYQSIIPINYLRKVTRRQPDKTVNVGIIGFIDYDKGATMLLEMISLASAQKKNIKFYLFGNSDNPNLLKKVIYKGLYEREKLPDLMEQNHIDLIFIPSIWGETFCRTAQEAIEMEIPVAVFDIGAPPERVCKYPLGLVIERLDAQCALDSIIDFVGDTECRICMNQNKSERQITASEIESDLRINIHVKPICFYLPQYHPIEINNISWGEGFTDWTNVVKTRPRFPGHVQPKYPGKFGFYDLRLINILEQQAILAEQYGVYGFCFYYYRFGGNRVLETPIENLLNSPFPKFPFCLCWANENWTRAWDGKTAEVLLAQTYDGALLENIVSDLVRTFDDDRYIRVNGKPLFIIYQAAELPNPREWIERLREMVKHRTGESIELGTVFSVNFDIKMLSFLDFVIQFPPHRIPRGYKRKLVDPGLIKSYERRGSYEAYDDVMDASLVGAETIPALYPGVCPDWDNTPRRKADAHTLIGSTPEKFQKWVIKAGQITADKIMKDCLPEPFLFVNAWNEWAEGAMLEPSECYGLRYLEALRDGVKFFVNNRVSEAVIPEGAKNASG